MNHVPTAEARTTWLGTMTDMGGVSDADIERTMERFNKWKLKSRMHGLLKAIVSRCLVAA
ncbi:MAG: hypothetical protein Unbinned1446contig1001_4 [Prokaryotic dsDNA virus sp.]|nr:MAG: hypothetical protein Unbinned1446contig1001_4 [Prokaryotic dsDNA virus sp.]